MKGYHFDYEAFYAANIDESLEASIRFFECKEYNRFGERRRGKKASINRYSANESSSLDDDRAIFQFNLSESPIG